MHVLRGLAPFHHGWILGGSKNILKVFKIKVLHTECCHRGKTIQKQCKITRRALEHVFHMYRQLWYPNIAYCILRKGFWGLDVVSFLVQPNHSFCQFCPLRTLCAFYPSAAGMPSQKCCQSGVRTLNDYAFHCNSHLNLFIGQSTSWIRWFHLEARDRFSQRQDWVKGFLENLILGNLNLRGRPPTPPKRLAFRAIQKTPGSTKKDQKRFKKARPWRNPKANCRGDEEGDGNRHADNEPRIFTLSFQMFIGNDSWGLWCKCEK